MARLSVIRSMPGLFFLLLLLLFSATTAASSDGLVVRTTTGLVKGKLDTEDGGNAQAWLGIPYAAPPVGAKRFTVAAPHEPWAGTRDATAFGSACTQNLTAFKAQPDPTNSTFGEDCLFVNVWRPAAGCGASPLPVMFFIHGGSLMLGSGAEHTFRGANLSTSECVMVMTINYRLGPLGKLARGDIGK